MALPNTRSVWLLARPVPILPPGIIGLCHWGVLVTELSSVDITVFMSSTRLGGSGVSDTVLGVLCDLRTEGSLTRVRVQITNPFLLSSAKVWKRGVVHFIGTTTLSDEQIRTIGVSTPGLEV